MRYQTRRLSNHSVMIKTWMVARAGSSPILTISRIARKKIARTSEAKDLLTLSTVIKCRGESTAIATCRCGAKEHPGTLTTMAGVANHGGRSQVHMDPQALAPFGAHSGSSATAPHLTASRRVLSDHSQYSNGPHLCHSCINKHLLLLGKLSRG